MWSGIASGGLEGQFSNRRSYETATVSGLLGRKYPTVWYPIAIRPDTLQKKQKGSKRGCPFRKVDTQISNSLEPSPCAAITI
jgi:hypothetical protein